MDTDDALREEAAVLDELRNQIAERSPVSSRKKMPTGQDVDESNTIAHHSDLTRRAVLVTIGSLTSIAAGVAIGYEFFNKKEVASSPQEIPNEPRVVVVTTTTAMYPS